MFHGLTIFHGPKENGELQICDSPVAAGIISPASSAFSALQLGQAALAPCLDRESTTSSAALLLPRDRNLSAQHYYIALGGIVMVSRWFT